MMQIVLEPIGYVRGGRSTRKDDDWGTLEAEIALDPARFGPDALLSLDTFSHVEVLFYFDKFERSRIVTSARHPRGREDWPRVGIFAQRGSGRPNLLGVTICHLLRVAGHSVWIRGLDAIDGTPVLDLKPYISGFAPRGEIREPGWAIEIMADYWTCS